MWEYFLTDRLKNEEVYEGCREREAGRNTRWQRESPAIEYPEQVKCCADNDCTTRMKYGFFALKGGDWEEKSIFTVEVRATEWAFERMREACEKVAKDEAGRLGIAQGIVLKSTDFLRRIIAPAGEPEGVTMSYLRPNCNSPTCCWWQTGDSASQAKVLKAHAVP